MTFRDVYERRNIVNHRSSSGRPVAKSLNALVGEGILEVVPGSTHFYSNDATFRDKDTGFYIAYKRLDSGVGNGSSETAAALTPRNGSSTTQEKVRKIRLDLWASQFRNKYFNELKK